MEINPTTLIINSFQAEEYYQINFEIDAAMKAEKIDLQGSSSDSRSSDNTGQYSGSSSVSTYNTEDQFRSGPIDYTL